MMMKKWMICLIGSILLLACGRGATVRNENPETLGFSFFLFVKVRNSDFRASGDAFIIYKDSLKMRVFDNLLNRHLFDFQADAFGTNEIIIPSEKMIYLKQDPAFASILTEYLYDIFSDNGALNIKTLKTNELLLENNRIETIILSRSEKKIRVDVLKRFPDGKPGRIKIESGGDYFIFDITAFTRQDFLIEKEGFRQERDIPEENFFEWLGEFNAER
jgi:hypothetical protein